MRELRRLIGWLRELFSRKRGPEIIKLEYAWGTVFYHPDIIDDDLFRKSAILQHSSTHGGTTRWTFWLEISPIGRGRFIMSSRGVIKDVYGDVPGSFLATVTKLPYTLLK